MKSWLIIVLAWGGWVLADDVALIREQRAVRAFVADFSRTKDRVERFRFLEAIRKHDILVESVAKGPSPLTTPFLLLREPFFALPPADRENLIAVYDRAFLADELAEFERSANLPWADQIPVLLRLSQRSLISKVGVLAKIRLADLVFSRSYLATEISARLYRSSWEELNALEDFHAWHQKIYSTSKEQFSASLFLKRAFCHRVLGNEKLALDFFSQFLTLAAKVPYVRVFEVQYSVGFDEAYTDKQNRRIFPLSEAAKQLALFDNIPFVSPDLISARELAALMLLLVGEKNDAEFARAKFATFSSGLIDDWLIDNDRTKLVFEKFARTLLKTAPSAENAPLKIVTPFISKGGKAIFFNSAFQKIHVYIDRKGDNQYRAETIPDPSDYFSLTNFSRDEVRSGEYPTFFSLFRPRNTPNPRESLLVGDPISQKFQKEESSLKGLLFFQSRTSDGEGFWLVSSHQNGNEQVYGYERWAFKENKWLPSTTFQYSKYEPRHYNHPYLEQFYEHDKHIYRELGRGSVRTPHWDIVAAPMEKIAVPQTMDEAAAHYRPVLTFDEVQTELIDKLKWISPDDTIQKQIEKPRTVAPWLITKPKFLRSFLHLYACKTAPLALQNCKLIIYGLDPKHLKFLGAYDLEKTFIDPYHPEWIFQLADNNLTGRISNVGDRRIIGHFTLPFRYKTDDDPNLFYQTYQRWTTYFSDDPIHLHRMLSLRISEDKQSLRAVYALFDTERKLPITHTVRIVYTDGQPLPNKVREDLYRYRAR